MRYVFLLFVSAATSAIAAPPGGVDFQRQVRPILSDNCFHCHGPDKNTRLMDLRLDIQEGAFAKRANGAVIVPGKPEASLLYQRISHAKPAMRMPPAASNKKITPEQQQIIRKWIEQGAEWKEHWSFQPVTKKAPPVVQYKSWVRNPIDNFVLAKLEAMGLRPGMEADRRTLLRRVTLDLTGLPPTPAEINAFVADRAPNAYEKVVDRLLASPRWGEHRGRYWLDAARYADTHGLHIDNYREMWPYRDWVIRAFNNNLPFDRFTIEQLAGDMLPNRTLDQQVASGFNRCNITTNEGGSIAEEVDAMYQKDRVETTSTVWLGLTTGCATCHDHKFDPIQQKEFYQLVAFFKNTTQKPLDGNIPDTPPVIFVPQPDDVTRWEELERSAKELRERKAERVTAVKADFETWLNTEERKTFTDPSPDALVSLPLREGAGTSVKGTVRGKETSLALNETFQWRKGPMADKALQFAKAALEIPGIDEFDPAEPLSVSAWVFFPNTDETWIVASHADKVNQARGWVFNVTGRLPRFQFASPALQERVLTQATASARMRPNSWNHVALTYDGSKLGTGVSLFVNGKPVSTESAIRDAEEELKVGDVANMAMRIGSDGRRYFPGGGLADLRIYKRELSEDEVTSLAQWGTEKNGNNALLLTWLNKKDHDYQELASQSDIVEKERRAIRRKGGLTHVMAERPDKKPSANVLFRGMYDQPRDEVFPDVPSALPPMGQELPRNRFGLAQWLIDPSNPLTTRVTVNRFWQEIFGTGIVKTAEDFGSQGQPPTHPELLDWMAATFRESGWDMKAFYKMMVMSATYRQSAAATPYKLKKDPENRMLSRGPRFRMDAEMVRDYALAVSGLLTPVIGGPSVKPYQPAGIWETVAMKNSTTRFYKQDHGESLYRRSMYTLWKRSAPPASMEIFNAPSRENCTVRRERTNTPLQALVTMNDVQFVEAARTLAAMAMREPAEFGKRLDQITVRVLGRAFDARERLTARASFNDFVAYYKAHEEEARKLITAGESKVDESLPAAEYAAWTMMANQVFNLDEALNK
ncbi:MAG: DUF1553 domain-containing protein [Acidobacteria bacterium]|nr:DUF1553 domain-containing protein [Acidobacteriota bacterium]